MGDVGTLLAALWSGIWGLLLNVLVAINSVVNNPGLAIIIFTVLIRLLTVPITMKALRSSRNMQALQPKLKEIQKRYANDRAKQQEETMKLYHEYGVNPAAGCFPMLIQLPVFFGLYSALQFVVGLHNPQGVLDPQRLAQLKEILFNPAWLPAATTFNQPFAWIPSLAAADPYRIMPILAGVFQFIQTRMSLPARNPNSPQDSQQKMMNGLMQFMPLYIVFISWGFPAGTVIYWAFSSLFGAVQQYFITGFGTLPDLPGLHWLPRKVMTPPPSPPEPVPGKKSRGLMSRMMGMALEAQETQKASQSAGAVTPLSGDANIASTNGATTTTGQTKGRGRGSTRPTRNGKESQPYRVDAEVEALTENGSGNKAYTSRNGQANLPAPLPRKKRSKR